MAGKVYKGNYGVPVRVATGMDLSNVTSSILLIKKPDGREASWTATKGTPETDGILEYTSISGDFDVSGNFQLQAEVSGTGFKFTGETAIFKIWDKWE